MNDEERAILADAGWVETTVQEMFGLDDADMKIIDLRLAVSDEVRRLRRVAKVSQAKLAGRLGVAQPRISGIEAAADGTSTDAILSAYFALGGTLASLAGLFLQDVAPAPQAVAKEGSGTVRGLVGAGIPKIGGKSRARKIAAAEAVKPQVMPAAKPAAKVKRVDKATRQAAKPAAPEVVGGAGREARKRKTTKV